MSGERPEILDEERDAARLHELRQGPVEIHDTLREQQQELGATRDPREGAKPPPASARGKWIWYPWSRRLVHLLGEAEFVELRTDRNRYKITASEQRRLRSARIGVAGLSVGQSTAVTLALEGVGGHFRLADFDPLSLSNLNRLRAGVHELGINKAIVAAREMYEIDPYLEVETFTDGVTDANIDRFLDGLDLLVEECDDLYMKVRLRERARGLGLPVIMETSDRGLLDVERFDRERARPIFHGLLGDVSAASLRGLPTKQKVPYVLRILGERTLSPEIAASLAEVKQSLSTWPQLGSAVTLGGALVTDAARRILLDQFHASGRFYVDLGALVSDATPVEVPPPPPLLATVIDEAAAPPSLPPRPAPAAGPPTREEIAWILVAHGTLAPSGGNVQPWRFRAGGSVVRCFVDGARAATLLDFEQAAARLAVGAAVESMTIAAAELGLAARVTPILDGDWVCTIELSREAAPRDPLFVRLAERVTNRQLGPRAPIAEADAAALVDEAARAGARLQLLQDGADLDRVAAIAGGGDRVRFLSERMHGEMMGELRWDPDAIRRLRDGLDVATLEMSATDAAVLRVFSSWPAMRHLRHIGGGKALEDVAGKAIGAAGAVGLLSIDGTTGRSYFDGGRALARVWLAATARGLAFQPCSVLPYLFARLERGGGEGLDEGERAQLGELRRRWSGLFGDATGRAELLLFRLAHAAPPTARSLRRGVEEVLAFDD